MRAAALLLALAVAGAASVVAADSLLHVRVFRLGEMETGEAVTLLRTRVHVRRIAELRARDVVVVADDPERVAAAEAILRERGGLADVVVPHDPVPRGVPEGVAVEGRVWRAAAGDTQGCAMLLRSIYGVRDLEVNEDDGTLVVRDTPVRLDAGEATLREIHLLADAGGERSRD